MPLGFSLYLDLLRVTAAFMVCLNHAAYGRLHGGWVGAWGRYGHDAVVVFFVLSGFLISHVAHTRDRGALDFAVARLARLWSVALPALAICYVLDLYGAEFSPKLYDGWWYQADEPVKRFTTNALFLAETWQFNLRAFSNGPMWSVQYEAWYYLGFGLLFFPQRAWVRWPLLALAAAAAGPAIVMLAPCWLIGVGLQRVTSRPTFSMSRGAGLSLLAFSVALYVSFRAYDLKPVLERWAIDTLDGPTREHFGVAFMHVARFSRSFVHDIALSLVVALHLLSVYVLSPWWTTLLRPFSPAIRWVAGLTFALYLFHYPLLHFYASISPHSGVNLLLTLQSVVLLAMFTERAKGRYRDALAWVAGGFASGVGRLRGGLAGGGGQ